MRIENVIVGKFSKLDSENYPLGGEFWECVEIIHKTFLSIVSSVEITSGSAHHEE